MNTKQQVGKLMLRHSLCWGWALITPPVVMVVLDAIDKHTPTSVALGSSMLLMVPFIFSNAFLSKSISQLVQHEESQ